MKKGTGQWRVAYQRPIKYEIVTTSDLFSPRNKALLSVGRGENSRRLVVVDSKVYRYHSSAISDYFALNKIEVKIVSFPGGEENKSLESYLSILKELDAFPINRRDEPIIAIGGGVLTDTVGFVASSYRRGVPHINIPTTLMGYVDASIGIKTGINFNNCKNRLGSFHPPVEVILDRAFLKTLPRLHILNGMSEILKLAIIKDFELFKLLESTGVQAIASNFQDDTGCEILDRAITGMVDELQPNLFEEDLARRMDFGHTFGYGIEALKRSHLLHGEAVLLDIAISVLIARSRNLLSTEETDRIFNLFNTLEMKLFTGILDPIQLWSIVEERVLHRNGAQRIPMPNGIGNCVFINDICPEEIQSAVYLLRSELVLSQGSIREC